MKLIEVARAGHVKLFLPRSTWYSFFNSPYPAHRHCTAVDAYFEGEALTPVEEGVVAEIKWFDAPRIRPDAEKLEPLILLELGGGLVLKVLHVKPSVHVGEKVYAGDPLGRIIVSGYLYPWSHPHAHFEVRPARDPYRARGALPLDLTPSVARAQNFGPGKASYTVLEVCDHYAWLAPSRRGFSGLSLLGGWIDGGIPHYGYAAVFAARTLPETLPTEPLPSPAPGVLMFAPRFTFEVSSEPVRGVACYLNQPLLKVIELGRSLREGDAVNIRIYRLGDA